MWIDGQGRQLTDEQMTKAWIGAQAHVEKIEAENAALRQRVAELESAQRWVPVEDDFIYNGANGNYERMVLWYDGLLRVSGPDTKGVDAMRSIRLPDAMRLCRLVATPTPGEGGEP